MQHSTLIPNTPQVAAVAEARSTASQSTGSAPAARGRSVRLTRRGRLFFLGLPVMAILLALVMGFGLAGTSADASTDKTPAVRTVTVKAGQSLWSVAQESNPDVDPRQVVADIREMNSLDDSTVAPGQLISVPVYTR